MKLSLKKKTTEDEVVAEEETSEEEVIEEEESYDVEADVAALLEGEELSEEFQDKAKTIFETAIKLKLQKSKKNLQESYATALVEELETIKGRINSKELMDTLSMLLTSGCRKMHYK